MPESPWYTAQSILTVWPDARTIPETQRQQFLDAALDQCLEYAPELAEGAEVPARYVLAHMMQTRALWTAQKAGAGDTIGPEGYTVRVYPMDWQIKALLRPPRATPGVG